MPDSIAGSGSALLWVGVALIIVAAVARRLCLVQGPADAGRARLPGQPPEPRATCCFRPRSRSPKRASSTTRRNGSVAREQSMHLAHIASVAIDRNLFFADVMIESSGGASPVRCHGHRKADAIEMKRLIEQFQSEYYRSRGAAGGTGEAPRPA